LPEKASELTSVLMNTKRKSQRMKEISATWTTR